MSSNTRVDDYTIDGELHKVLINNEGQYSIWPAGQEAPKGWTETGTRGSKSECSEYVQNNWTDMRPLSLQKEMSKTSH